MKNIKVVEVEIIINKRKDLVWNTLFGQFSKVSNFHPFLKNSHLLSEKDGQLGTERQCDLIDGSFIKEKIISVSKNNSFDVEITEGPEMYKTFIATFELTELEGTHSKVKCILHNSSALPSEMVEQLTQTFTNVFIALKYYLETGNEVKIDKIETISNAYANLKMEESFGMVV